MILDKIRNIDNYKGIIPDNIIKRVKLAKGESIKLKSQDDKQYELHKKHKDLFVCLKGPVLFYYMFMEINENKDICIIDDYQKYIEISSGEFLLIDEGVLHKPGIKKNINDEKAIMSVIKIEV